MNEFDKEIDRDQPLSETFDDIDDMRRRATHVALRTPEGFLAFGFGSGLLTRAPGTMGTLAAIPVAVVASLLEFNSFFFLTLTFFAGIWLCERTTQKLGIDDYGGIVWDEMVGFWLVVTFIPFHWAWWLAAFVLFRGFDILKPWPISLIEDSFDGGLGIMLDDILAAVYAVIVLAFIERIMLSS